MGNDGPDAAQLRRTTQLSGGEGFAPLSEGAPLAVFKTGVRQPSVRAVRA